MTGCGCMPGVGVDMAWKTRDYKDEHLKRDLDLLSLEKGFGFTFLRKGFGFTFLIFMFHLREKGRSATETTRTSIGERIILLFFILNSTEMEEMGLQGQALEKGHFGALGLHHQTMD